MGEYVTLRLPEKTLAQIRKCIITAEAYIHWAEEHALLCMKSTDNEEERFYRSAAKRYREELEEAVRLRELLYRPTGEGEKDES